VETSAAVAAVRESAVPAEAVRSDDDETNNEPLSELTTTFPLKSDNPAGDLTKKFKSVAETSTPDPAPVVPVLRNMLD
jgi:hypothetical protein